jgi:hypothetical protein
MSSSPTEADIIDLYQPIFLILEAFNEMSKWKISKNYNEDIVNVDENKLKSLKHTISSLVGKIKEPSDELQSLRSMACLQNLKTTIKSEDEWTSLLVGEYGRKAVEYIDFFETCLREPHKTITKRFRKPLITKVKAIKNEIYETRELPYRSNFPIYGNNFFFKDFRDNKIKLGFNLAKLTAKVREEKAILMLQIENNNKNTLKISGNKKSRNATEDSKKNKKSINSNKETKRVIVISSLLWHHIYENEEKQKYKVNEPIDVTNCLKLSNSISKASYYRNITAIFGSCKDYKALCNNEYKLLIKLKELAQEVPGYETFIKQHNNLESIAAPQTEQELDD